MTSKDILYSKGNNDECYTPAYVVKPILKYIPKDSVVWCPFDKANSQFVKLITENGNKVIYSHIDNGEDFLTYEPEEKWDCIISNPLFTNKRKYFERALSFGKPFALIMSNTWLNDAAPVKVFFNKGLQLLLFDKRINFMNDKGETLGRPSFASSYFCYGLLPQQIITERLEM